MALVRCPQCGRVADGKACFACGYEWAAGQDAPPAVAEAKPSAPAPPDPRPPTPAPAKPPPSTERTSGPFASPLAPPRAHTPTRNGSLAVPAARAPTPGPFHQGRGTPMGSFTAPTAAPDPDEIIIDTDLDFSLEKRGSSEADFSSLSDFSSETDFSSVGQGSGASPSPGGRPPAPAAPDKPMDSLFDGIDLDMPTAVGQVMDATMEAGDFLVDEPEPPAAPSVSPSQAAGLSANIEDWSTSELGADLIAAFNAPEPGNEERAEEEANAAAAASWDVADPGEHSLADRLRELASRLRSEGRTEEADLVTEAMATISMQM